MWMVFSLAAAVTWGVDYFLAEKTLEKISVLTFTASALLLSALVVGIIALFSPQLRTDIEVLSSDRRTLLFFLGSTLAFILGNIFIVTSIKASNATWAGLIEITYPLFIILFGWLFFREQHLSPGVVVGGLLILAGVTVIALFQK